MPPDTEQPGPFADVAEVFRAQRIRDARQLADAQAWTPTVPVKAEDMDLGTFDSVTPLNGDDIGNVYARLTALSVQRLRVLSAQLAEQYRDHGMAAFVRDQLLYNPATNEVEVAGEQSTQLARQDFEERKLLKDLLTTAVRLKLEVQSQQAVAQHGLRQAVTLQAFAEQCGLDWNEPETRRMAQQAVLRAEAEVARATQ